jgi:hypothetical protein
VKLAVNQLAQEQREIPETEGEQAELQKQKQKQTQMP